MPVMSETREISGSATLASNTHTPHPSFEQAAAQVLGNLQRMVAELFKAGSVEVRKAGDLERGFGLDRKLSWQVHRVATAENPLAAGASVPTRASMQRLLKAVEKRKAPAAALERVSTAFDRFEQFVSEYAGDRETLDAMLSVYLPEAREKQELAGKEASFRGMSQIKGVAIETTVDTYMMHPTADGKRVDGVLLAAVMGLLRVHPDAHFNMSLGVPGRQPVLTLDGREGRHPNDSLLPEFCSSPTPDFERSEKIGSVYFWIPGTDMGLRSAIDIVKADYVAGVKSAYREPDGRTMSQVAIRMESPAKRLVKDVFVHRDLFPGSKPQLAIHETLMRSVVTTFDDPAREQDRLRMQETIVPLPGGLPHAQISHIPRYVEMLEYVCRKRGWDAGAFRGYRLDVQYPVYGAQYSMGFELPESPLRR